MPWSCILCRRAVEADDVVVGHAPTGRCVCLGCYTRNTDSGVTMARAYLRTLVEAAGKE